MRLLFATTLVAALAGVPAAFGAAAPSTTVAVTAALLAHEKPLAKKANAQVACQSVVAHQTIIQCETYGLVPSPTAKQMTFPGQVRWVSRVAEAYRFSGCTYRVNVSVGSTLATVYTGLLNVCGKNWARGIGA